MGIREAYDAVLENENWKSKVFICGLLVAPSSILSGMSEHFKTKDIGLSIVLLVLNCFFSFVLTGYFTQTIRNSLKNSTDFIPKLKANFGKYIFIGAKYTTAMTCVFILMLTAFIPLLLNKDFMVLSIIVYLILLLTFLIIAPAINIYFSTNFKFRSVFNFKQAIEMIKMGKGAYAKFLGSLSLIYILNIVVMILLAVTIVGIIVVPFAAAFVMIVAAYLHGEFYQEAIENFKSQAAYEQQ